MTDENEILIVNLRFIKPIFQSCKSVFVKINVKKFKRSGGQNPIDPAG